MDQLIANGHVRVPPDDRIDDVSPEDAAVAA